MQAATQRPLLAHTLNSQESRTCARIDTVGARQLRSFSAKPIPRLTAAFVSALQRIVGPIGSRELQAIRDDDVVTILSNARRMKMIARSQWKIGSNSAGT